MYNIFIEMKISIYFNPKFGDIKMTDFTYTDELVDNITARYNEVRDESYETRNAVVKQIAEEIGATVPQVRGKLVSLGIYVAKEVAKTAGSYSKNDYAAALAAITGADAKDLNGATRKGLKVVFEFIRDASIKAE